MELLIEIVFVLMVLIVNLLTAVLIIWFRLWQSADIGEVKEYTLMIATNKYIYLAVRKKKYFLFSDSTIGIFSIKS